MTHNHKNYEKRLVFVRELLRERFGVDKPAKIEPIQYDPECPFKYNNFVYKVSLPAPLTAVGNGTLSRSCVPVPDGTTEVILRLTNSDADGMHNATRVENEVATMGLAATSLKDLEPHIVPSVYGWASAAEEGSQGWILQELMPGTPLDEAFESLDFPQKRNIFSQIASILKGLQNHRLPSTITGFGGLTFDPSGQVVSAAMTSIGAGPWPSYEVSYRSRLEVVLKEADSNPYIKGWNGNGVRERLDAFVQKGVANLFRPLSSKEDRVITHADFTANNILWDQASGRITGLVDYDFASISHPSHEFLNSFNGIGGQLQGWSQDASSEEAALRDAKLNGFPSPLPANTEDGVKWDEAKAWEEALELVEAKRPRTMAGIEKVADVDTVLRAILPWRLSNSDILRMQSEDAILRCRSENEGVLIKLLDRLGF